jgi:hypothetical protein
MFSFVTVTHSNSAVTRSVSRAGGSRNETVFESDRRVPLMEDSNAWPVSAAEVALANAKNRPEREEPWRRRLTGAGFILGLALRGLALPVGL